MAFLRATIFNLATGNTANHAKNHSLLYRGSRPELAPLYDLAPGLPELDMRRDFAFRIGHAARMEALTPEDLTAFLHDLGFSRGLSRTVKVIMDLLRTIRLTLDPVLGSEPEEMADMIADRLQIIAEALQLPIDLPKGDSSE